jgi:predicted RecB family nuclease
MKITNEVLEGYLNCKTKGHLKLAGKGGVVSDYETMIVAAGRESRETSLARLSAQFSGGDACQGIAVTSSTLKQGAPLLVDAVLEDDSVSLRFDALKRDIGPSKLGDYNYLPVLHSHGDKVGRPRKLLLAVLGLALAPLQGIRPAVGMVAHGPEGRLRKVRLDAKLYRQAEKVLGEVKQLQEKGEPPRLTLNGHCRNCEFRQGCRSQAEEADDISLLEGVGEKELSRYHRKGLFTLTQLSCTFRPRKRNKRVRRPSSIHYSSLQALAIREKKIHVYGTPNLPQKRVQIFFDAEGNEDSSFAYLLGVIVTEGDKQKRQSFWADGADQEVQAFDAFLDLIAAYDEFTLFHYGSYEKLLLRRMRKVVKRKKLVDRILANAANVLSVIHASVYFPTFSNGLKEIGRYLGYSWTEEDASGLQSLVWRARWEQRRDAIWKENLVTYNAEDCAALKLVTECVQAIGQAASTRGERKGDGSAAKAAFAWADELTAPQSRGQWCRPKFALQDFEYINQCAYFDYQRDKVFVRTGTNVRRGGIRPRKRRKAKRLRANRKIEIRSNKCPFCKGTQITRMDNQRHTKCVYDLKFTSGGFRRQVIRCTAVLHRCQGCEKTFLPRRYMRLDKYLHGLKSWAIYQHIVHRISFRQLQMMFEDCFGLRVDYMEVPIIKMLMAKRYRNTLNRSLARILAGGLAHVDETHINLQDDKGYIWAVTNLKDVVYMYRPNRETAFLQELLRDFKGVLVTDFYSGYDSLPCPQQKCLVHLILDFNTDLMRHPYDEDFKALAAEFGALLRPIVSTIDKYGFKKRHLHKHKADVAHFYRALESRVYRSELAESYQTRFLKNKNKLFVFLDHDGVPWNNNPAEHAVKGFVYVRVLYDGKMKEAGLSDHIVLLSVYQTCKYRGVSFLKFLLSGERDVEAFCQRGLRKKRPPRLEVYPKGFSRSGRRSKGAKKIKNETP